MIVADEYMGFEEFKDSKMVKSHITYENFSADISYSTPGSGHYFTLRRLTGKLKSLIKFLDQWEENYTFCIITWNADVRKALEAREYTTDENNNLRKGIKIDRHEKRIARWIQDIKPIHVPRGVKRPLKSYSDTKNSGPKKGKKPVVKREAAE